MTGDSTSDAVAAVLAAESERCSAISRNDFDVLEGLLADDLIYTHSNGHTEGKRAVVEGLRQHARTVERSNLNVRVFGDVAVVTGEIALSFPPTSAGDELPRIDGVALQVWTKEVDHWQLSACQVTRRIS